MQKKKAGNSKQVKNMLILFIVLVLAVIYVFPLYIAFANALKTYDQVILDTAGLPSPAVFENFVTVWNQIAYPRAFMNTLFVTAGSLLGILLFCGMGTYMLVRRPGKISNIIFMTIVSMMVVPFQSMMIPLIKIGNRLHLINSLPGLILIYIGCGVPFAVFLYHGFIKGIPRELEESDMIDGCCVYGTFIKIVLPLLKPITTTIAVLDVLWLWNDFLLPMITLSSKELRTLTLSYFFYFGEFVNQWNLALAAVILAIIPAVIFYMFSQKYIVEGITAGAMKG